MSLGSARLWNRRKAGVSYKLLFLRPLMLLLFKAFSCFLTKAGQRKILARDMWTYWFMWRACIQILAVLKAVTFAMEKWPGGHSADIFRCLWWAERTERLKEALKRWCVGTVIQIFWWHFSWSPGLLWPQRATTKKSVSPQPKFFFFLPVLLPTVHFLWVYTVFSFYLFFIFLILSLSFIGLMVNSRSSLNSIINKSCSQAQQWTKKRLVFFFYESRKCFGWMWSCKWADSPSIHPSIHISILIHLLPHYCPSVCMNVPVFCVQQIAPSGINEAVWYNFGLNVTFLDLIFHREVLFFLCKKTTQFPHTQQGSSLAV